MRRLLAGFILVTLALALVACGQGAPKETVPGEVATPAGRTFAEHTELAIFQDLPAADMEKYSIMVADDYGDGWYVLALKATQLPALADYTDYIAALEQAGYVQYSSSGDTGIGNGAMLAATLQKGNKVVSLSFAKYYGMFYIAAAENKPLSPHLLYNESCIADNIPGAKTTLTMNQLSDQGNCYVLKLKNGHYIINDGGFPADIDCLIRSLEEGAPEGQKPVVEAWFISHEHLDHVGVLQDSAMYTDRLCVEGFYLNEVPEDLPVGSDNFGRVNDNVENFRTVSGEYTPVYRMHGGERYYFSDITVEVPHTTEQVAIEDYSDFNTSSIWLMYYIEGQKFLLAGDATIHSMRIISQTFDASYFDVDIMNMHHHAANLYVDNLNYFKCETLLYSTVCCYSIYWSNEVKENNLRIQKDFCEEYMSYADGGKKLTFPYTVGSYETLDPWYPDLSEYWVEREQGWLRDLGLA